MNLDYKIDLERLSNRNQASNYDSIFLIKNKNEKLMNDAERKIALLEEKTHNLSKKNECLERQILDLKSELVTYIIIKWTNFKKNLSWTKKINMKKK